MKPAKKPLGILELATDVLTLAVAQSGPGGSAQKTAAAVT